MALINFVQLADAVDQGGTPVQEVWQAEDSVTGGLMLMHFDIGTSSADAQSQMSDADTATKPMPTTIQATEPKWQYDPATEEYSAFDVDGIKLFTVKRDSGDTIFTMHDAVGSPLVLPGVCKTWTPIFNGFSTDPTVIAARYARVGRLVSVYIFLGNGTSNSTGFTLTLPIAASSISQQLMLASVVTDGGIAQTVPGLLRTNINSITLDVFKTMDITSLWTASGGKKIQASFTYESV